MIRGRWLFSTWLLVVASGCGSLRLAAIASDGGLGEPDASEVGDANDTTESPLGDAGASDDGSRSRTCPPASDKPAAVVYVTNPATVFDSVTRLEWERPFRSAEIVSYENAKETCAALRYAGHADWRVPTRSELFSIIDYAQPAIKISRAIFPGAGSDPAWTSSQHGPGPNDFWLIDFFSGVTMPYSELLNDAGSPQVPIKVRCVRTVDPPCMASPRFVQIGKPGDVVRDEWTGLEWEGHAGGAPRSLTDAAAYCAALAGGDPKRLWRVPSAKEADSLVMTDAAHRFIDPLFLPSTWPRWWTGAHSTWGGLDSRFALDLNVGVIRELVSDLSTRPLAVRCVR